MQSDIPHQPGIYRITNLATGNLYIGSSVDLRRRWYFHTYQLGKGIHHNPRLQAAWTKYGAANFKFEILQVLKDRSEILAAEQTWLDSTKAATDRLYYNFYGVAGSPAGTKRSPETCARISAANKGKKITDEAKAKMRLAKIGRPLSAEHRAKIGDAGRGKKLRPRTDQEKSVWRKLTPDQVRELRTLRLEGWSIPQLARHFQIGKSTVHRILTGENYTGVV